MRSRLRVSPVRCAVGLTLVLVFSVGVIGCSHVIRNDTAYYAVPPTAYDKPAGGFTKGTGVAVLERGPLYSKVMTIDGTTGYVLNSDVRSAWKKDEPQSGVVTEQFPK